MIIGSFQIHMLQRIQISGYYQAVIELYGSAEGLPPDETTMVFGRSATEILEDIRWQLETWSYNAAKFI